MDAHVVHSRIRPRHDEAGDVDGREEHHDHRNRHHDQAGLRESSAQEGLDTLRTISDLNCCFQKTRPLRGARNRWHHRDEDVAGHIVVSSARA
jgi:hypothetical protein